MDPHGIKVETFMKQLRTNRHTQQKDDLLVSFNGEDDESDPDPGRKDIIFIFLSYHMILICRQ